MAKAAAGPVTELLTRLDAAIAKHHPKLQRKLNKGASAAALAKLEKVAGARLPEAFTAFLRWHDGAPSEIRPLDGMCWLDAKRCASTSGDQHWLIALAARPCRPGLWATPYAEIQDIQRLGFSADGRRLFEGGGSGRVYVWAV